MEKTTGNYELLYIVHPDLESSIDKILEKARGYIEKRDGKITYDENWGKRKLAYEINKTDVGIYILWYFTAPKSAVAKIEKDIRLTEEVLRYMILTQEEEKEEKPKKKKAKKAEPKEEKTEVKKTTKKTETKPKKKESEKARMEKIDEKLGELLGDEDNKKEAKKKEA